MAKELDSKRGVTVQYGVRGTGRAAGNLAAKGGRYRKAVDITGEALNDGLISIDYIPAESLIEKAYVQVEEAFVLGGTTPTILVGTDGSEATNGVVVSEAQAESAGQVLDISGTLTGTWAAGLAADTKIGLELGGTSPTADSSVGKARLVIEYVKI